MELYDIYGFLYKKLNKKTIKLLNNLLNNFLNKKKNTLRTDNFEATPMKLSVLSEPSSGGFETKSNPYIS